MSRLYVFSVLTIIVPGLPLFGSSELSHLFDNRANTWQLNSDVFMKIQAGNGFKWNSNKNKNTARSTQRNLSFLGFPIYEVIAKFKNNGLSKVTLSIYNRGDAGWVGDVGLLNEDGFNLYLRKVNKSVGDWASKNVSKIIKKRLSSKIYSYRKYWEKDDSRVSLKWSSTEKHKVNGQKVPFRIEYIKLELTPSKRASSNRNIADSNRVEKHISIKKAKSNVKRDRNNDIYIDNIPMVDQGNKNYCAVATLSRIMGYYGREYDQHEVAQMVDANFLGTDPELMVSAIKKLGFKLGVKVRTHKEFELNKLIKIVERYDRLAKRKKLRKINYKVTSIADIYRQFDTELLKRVCTKRKENVIKFSRDITRHINIGIPLAWTVILGKVVETPQLPQSVGGHMRLIIGYNKIKKQVIYTDSWGRGHEYKYMNIEDALTITTGLYTIEPRSRRH